MHSTLQCLGPLFRFDELFCVGQRRVGRSPTTRAAKADIALGKPASVLARALMLMFFAFHQVASFAVISWSVLHSSLIPFGQDFRRRQRIWIWKWIGIWNRIWRPLGAKDVGRNACAMNEQSRTWEGGHKQHQLTATLVGPICLVKSKLTGSRPCNFLSIISQWLTLPVTT